MIVNFNYEALINLIDVKYGGKKIENKINMFCKDCQIKVYRFKRILEGKGYFQTDEIMRMIKALGLKKNDISYYFFNVL